MRFSRASSARSDPIEPAPRACPFDASGTFPLRLIARATGSLHGPLGTIDATALTAACPSCYLRPRHRRHRGGISRSRGLPGSNGAALSVLRTGASRAQWPPFWMRGPCAGCRCGRTVRRDHGDFEAAGADGRPHPQRHLLMSSVQHRHLGSLGDGRMRGRLPVGLRQARVGDAEGADRREEATGHQEASGRAGRSSKHGILTSGRVSYTHAFVSASCLRWLEPVPNHRGERVRFASRNAEALQREPRAPPSA